MRSEGVTSINAAENLIAMITISATYREEVKRKKYDRKYFICVSHSYLQDSQRSRKNQLEREFEQKPQIERKELVRKLIEKITVDPDTDTIICYFRRLPSIGEVLDMNGNGHFVLGGASSPNGNILHPVGECLIRELNLASP